MRNGWFGPKRIGWGVSPKGWQGWLVTAALIAGVAASMRWLRPALEDGYGWPPATAGFAIIGVWLAIYAAVVFLTYQRGEKA
jgi:hypothetical protein